MKSVPLTPATATGVVVYDRWTGEPKLNLGTYEDRKATTVGSVVAGSLGVVFLLMIVLPDRRQKPPGPSN